MVCNGVAGVGASGNTPEKKPVQQAQPQQQEEASLWSDVKNIAKKVLTNNAAQYTFAGQIYNHLDADTKATIKDSVKSYAKEVVENGKEIAEDFGQVAKTVGKYTVAGMLYNSIFGEDEEEKK